MPRADPPHVEGESGGVAPPASWARRHAVPLCGLALVVTGVVLLVSPLAQTSASSGTAAGGGGSSPTPTPNPSAPVPVPPRPPPPKPPPPPVPPAPPAGGFYRRSPLPKQPAAGCSASGGWLQKGLASPGKTSVHTIVIGGVQRSYRVHLPRGYQHSQTLPLLIAYHGYCDTADEFEMYSAISDEADALPGNLSYVVAYPQGMGDINADADPQKAGDWYSWNGGGCSQSPGPLGETCVQSKTGNQPHYEVTSLDYLSCPDKQPGAWVPGVGGKPRTWQSSYCNACTCADDVGQ